MKTAPNWFWFYVVSTIRCTGSKPV